MKISSSSSLALGALLSLPTVAFGLGAGDADDMWNAYNKVFLNQNGSSAFYQKTVSDKTADPNWPGSFDIFVAQDVYQRTGNASVKNLVNDLVNTWLKNTPPPWHWDGWNDDIGWYTLGLIRGYQITGTADQLIYAMSGFDYAFGRGWNTTYNDGGIWEENPEYLKNASNADKQALSNDSLGKVACMIYQSTHNATYLARAEQIYGWVRTHIFDTKIGQVMNGIAQDGTVTPSKEAYNQGTFIDYANLLYKITGNQTYYNDAKLAVDFGKNNVTVNGIFSNDADYLNSWADEYARGAGNFVNDNNLWSMYYSFFVANANAVLKSRRPDLNITWNGWNKPTPENDTYITNKFVSAVAWLQYTPATQPQDSVRGTRIITNNQTGLAMDSAGAWGNGKAVAQNNAATAAAASSSSQPQRWLLTQNSDDESWNMVNQATWQALQAAGSGNDSVVQWQPSRDPSQRWAVEQQSDGTYKITNQQSGLALDGGSAAKSGAPLTQSAWNGGAQQRWHLE